MSLPRIVSDVNGNLTAIIEKLMKKMVHHTVAIDSGKHKTEAKAFTLLLELIDDLKTLIVPIGCAFSWNERLQKMYLVRWYMTDEQGWSLTLRLCEDGTLEVRCILNVKLEHIQT